MINGNRDQGQEDIVINLGKEANLVAITGETGSGKSLLIAKVVEYLMGCKASPTILPSADDATYAVIKVSEYIFHSSCLWSNSLRFLEN
jgi:DNA repair ATPase RecN